MKNIYKLGVFAAIIFLLGSCSKWIDTDLNIDPDSPSDVPVQLLLPSMQASAAYHIGGNTAVRTTNMWVQYFDGVSRQSLAEMRYNITPADVNNLWVQLYSQAMMDANVIIKKGEANKSPHYVGVAKVTMAMCLGTLTNLYGDIPYTDAFGGEEGVLQPKFDSQESIYNTIDKLLTEAIEALGSEDNAISLEKVDLIYDGNVDSWIKAAYALKARYSLYRKNYADAISNVDKSFTENKENFALAFDSSPSGANPIYQFMQQRTDIRMSSTFVDALAATNDPRLAYYCAVDDDDNYVGSVPGSENSAASKPGKYNAAINSSVVFSSLSEVLFIKAEALFRNGDKDGAAEAYKSAVAASLEYVVGKDTTGWLDANIDTETGASISLEKIMTQKYHATYSSVVAYDDWRRTGIPSLVDVKSKTGDTPVRFPYPQSEITYNSNCNFVPVDKKLWIFEQ